jgi:predicted RNase H-like HicB family nuclease
MKYVTIVEKTNTGYSIYAPDLPGCIATGKTRKAAERNMQEAIAFHIEGLQLAGYPIPNTDDSTVASYGALSV